MERLYEELSKAKRKRNPIIYIDNLTIEKRKLLSETKT